ncbi:hypothetical protein [Cuniculiplasma divulgatum]|jgi:hypothetical protein|uniref:Uncharacterized protein n=1 Tax=Cuniculiplasma divulgatum TaxID=1673428 RepID=A0A1R4A765_9ARCH|nr:hypothetical protein [Cuniculiplasma divulgatum]MCI2411912.1 hypothetical protein [Cuniculiplasma sp.]WMT49101.1 MAG: hypothetical protein RE472_08520 [Thermoplasmatales archaeon]SJK84817.1 hypothetical protein CPM_0979 [Cuniculiplasma divulgatum]
MVNEKRNIKLLKILFGVFSFFIMVSLALTVPVISEEISQGKTSRSIEVPQISPAKCTNSKAVQIYCKSEQKTFSYGTIYSILHVYECCGNFIYLLQSHLNANCKDNYWLAGNEGQSNGHLTGKTFLCCAMSKNPCGMVQQESFNAYGPSNILKLGSTGTITTTYSITGSGAVSYSYINAQLSGTYSFSYQYQVPCSETMPITQTNHIAAWQFSDNSDQNNIKPYAACYEVSASAKGSFPNGLDSICINDQEQVAHTGWFWITDYNWYSFVYNAEFSR